MPYYSGLDPSEIQQAAGNQFFNPLTGGVNWGALVGQVYKNIQSGRDRRKAEEIEKEERMWKHALNKANLDEAMWQAANRISPREQFEMKRKAELEDSDIAFGRQKELLQMRIDAAIKEQQMISDAQEKAAKAKAAAQKNSIDAIAKEYRTRRNEIEARYQKQGLGVESAHRTEVAKIRSNKNMAPTVGTTPSAYAIGIKGALDAKNRAYKLLEEAKKRELEQLDALYEQYLPGLSLRKQMAGEPVAPPKTEAEQNLPEGFSIIR